MMKPYEKMMYQDQKIKTIQTMMQMTSKHGEIGSIQITIKYHHTTEK